MDVKGIKDYSNSSGSNSSQAAQSKESTNVNSPKQKELRALASTQAAAVQAEVEVKIESRKANDNTRLRSRANDLINVVNTADEATAEIDKLVKSIDGIVQQASKEDLPEPRRAVLEKEANGLADEIRRKSNVDVSKVAGNADEEIRFEIEQSLGKSLESLFKEGAENAFGISQITFSPKESIINVRTSVAVAKERVEQLRSKVSDAKDQVGTSVAELDVALQNTASAESSLRDIDAALQVATQTKAGISKNPENAVSASRLSQNSLDLLK